MSSASSGRYQSRFFNFVHQQSRRLKEQCDRTFRHVRVATHWIAPIAYPLYLLFHSTESNERSPHQATSTSAGSGQLPPNHTDFQQQISAPTADTPIQRVLFLLNVPVEEAGFLDLVPAKKTLPLLAFLTASVLKRLKKAPITHNRHALLIGTETSQVPAIRGIATQLSSRTLVLSTAQNEILDILTPQQQQKLQERIVREVAVYWRYQRLALTNTQKIVPKHRHQQELKFHHQALAFVDRIVANLESKHLMLGSEVAITVFSFASSISKRSWQIVGRLPHIISSAQVQPFGSTLVTPDAASYGQFRLQALIWAAIDYVFGGRSSKPAIATRLPTVKLPTGSQSLQLPQRRKIFKSSPERLKQLADSEIDPWLNSSDLFGDLEPTDDAATLERALPELAAVDATDVPSSRSIGHSLVNLLNRLQKLLPQVKPEKKLVKRRKQYVVTARRTANKALKTGLGKNYTLSAASISQPEGASTTEIANQPREQKTQLQSTPDWIETYATSMGYVKHPLEQLLQWLDRVMLWLEELLTRVLQWARSHIVKQL